MKIIDNKLLDKLSEDAKVNERLRMNYNLHESLDESVQRLLNALEPGTILPIHRHKHTDETYLLVRGSLNVIVYNDRREITKRIELNHAKGVYGVCISKNEWHTVEVLEADTVIFEIKLGPYAPLAADDILL